MNAKNLEDRMREYEDVFGNQRLMPNVYMVARLDGRGFSKFTKDMKKPFDESFRDNMVNTMRALIERSGFNIIFATTHSDEISLLLDKNETSFNRKQRKYNTLLSSLAGSQFSLLCGDVATFDCRIIPLPDSASIDEYFLWRTRDSLRNCISGYAYWKLREDGESKGSATSTLKKKSYSEQAALLQQRFDIRVDKLPNWQKRGVGAYMEQYVKMGHNPITQDGVQAIRRRICVDYDVPQRIAVLPFVSERLRGS